MLGREQSSLPSSNPEQRGHSPHPHRAPSFAPCGPSIHPTEQTPTPQHSASQRVTALSPSAGEGELGGCNTQSLGRVPDTRPGCGWRPGLASARAFAKCLRASQRPWGPRLRDDKPLRETLVHASEANSCPGALVSAPGCSDCVPHSLQGRGLSPPPFFHEALRHLRRGFPSPGDASSGLPGHWAEMGRLPLLLK